MKQEIFNNNGHKSIPIKSTLAKLFVGKNKTFGLNLLPPGKRIGLPELNQDLISVGSRNCADELALLSPTCAVSGQATTQSFSSKERTMSQGLKYVVDLALCIDSTGSMSPIIDQVKAAALRFHDDLNSVMQEKNKAIDTLRLRVISFRDYWADGGKAMLQSQFFVLPEEADKFSKFVKEIEADGGGDEPENGLEALAFAIRSDWSKSGDRRRQLVVMWTDAPAHPLEKSSKPSGYPSEMPSNLDELTDMWDGQSALVSRTAKRLIIFAPDADPWTHIANHWENAVHFASRAGEGLADVTYKEILNAIANSV